MADVNRYTLAEYAGLAGLKGVDLQTVHTIVDSMPIFDSAPLIQCNAGTRNMTKVITAYPKGQLRGYNQGVKAEKAGAKIVQDTTCMMETYNEIDRRILAQNDNSAKWRSEQDTAFIRGLAQTAAEKIFNASLKRDPLEYDGLGVRYGKIGDCVIDAGGSGSRLSDIWLVNWSKESVHLLYPQGGYANPSMEYEANVDAVDEKGGKFKADRTWVRWDLGLAVPDPMQVIRIANVDLDAAMKGSSTVNLVNLLTQAVERLPGDAFAGCAFYMNRTLRSALRLQLMERPNMNFTWDNVAGKQIVRFDGIAVHKVVEDVLKVYNNANKIK